MILSYNGGMRGIGTAEEMRGLFIDYEFRDILPMFKGAPLAVFMCIALHTDTEGHAFVSYDTLMRETGYGSRTTIADALRVLLELTVKGERLLAQYRERRDDGSFAGSNHYLVFPDKEQVAEIDQSTAHSPETVLEDTNVSKDIPVLKPNKNLTVQKLDGGLDGGTVVDLHHPAYLLFLENGGRVNNPTKKTADGLTMRQRYAKIIGERIGDDPDDLEFWSRVVRSWVEDAGYRDKSYMGMIECYEDGRLPTSRRRVRFTKPPLTEAEKVNAQGNRADALRRIQEAKNE